MGGWVRALGVATALSLAAVTGAAAQQNNEAQARSYLEQGMEAHAAHGYQRERGVEDIATSLNLNSPYLWSVYLRAGVNYRVYGACDNNCSDLDLEVYGADGHLVDRDVAGDDTPYVQITPAASGRAYVRVWLYACAHEPCFVAVRVVSGGTPVERAEPSATETPQAENDSDAADNDYIGIVRNELASAGARHEAAGYAVFGEDKIEPIEIDGPGFITTVHLDAQYDYVFQGACDQDCSDADMEVRDASGAQLALDVDADDKPSVAVTPARTGDYGLRIWLAQCDVEPCYVGVRSYRRRR